MACHCGDPKFTCEPIQQQQSANRSYVESDGTVPPYLPQPSDFIAKTVKSREDSKMGPIGPWATGRPIWSATADIVGVQPVVDRYSITKYSPFDWRKRNLSVMDMVGETDEFKKSVKCNLDDVAEKTDKNQNDNSIRLQQRLQEIGTYQCQIEALVMDLREEIVLLTEAKVRLKFSMPILKTPESITGECIDKRTCRSEPDMVKDEVDIELINEMAMIYEVRELLHKMIQDVDKQIAENRSCKDELESDWSDKKETTEIETINACLRNNSAAISSKHGSTRIQNSQSTVESWKYYAETLVKLGSEQVKKSRDLRNNIDSDVFVEAVRNLKNQADKVTSLLKKRIRETEMCRQGFERQLQKVLFQIAEAESEYERLNKMLRQLDYSLKVAQTRLDNRMQRRRTENCRDEPQYGLIEEVAAINESQSRLRKQVQDLDLLLAKLYQTRANIEFQILTKRKSLYIDQERCMAYREHYPDVTTLTGASVPV